jgi:hypothetical protein
MLTENFSLNFDEKLPTIRVPEKESDFCFVWVSLEKT